MEHVILKDLRKKMEQIPFGNSAFQIAKMIVGKHPTPERQARQCLLEIDALERKLTECAYERDKVAVEIERLKEKIGSTTGYERQLALIEKDQKEYHLKYQEKLILDAGAELNCYYAIYETLPQDITRESFEKSEHLYWSKRLIADAEKQLSTQGRIETGTLDALLQIDVMPVKNAETGALEWKMPQEVLLEYKKEEVKQ